MKFDFGSLEPQDAETWCKVLGELFASGVNPTDCIRSLSGVVISGKEYNLEVHADGSFSIFYDDFRKVIRDYMKYANKGKFLEYVRELFDDETKERNDE